MTAPHEPADQAPEIGQNADAAPADQDAAQAELNELRAQLDAAQATVNEQRDQLLRAQAEAENVRRRAQEDVSKARKFGIESFAESLVPVKDSLEAALAQPDQTVDALREGVEVTLKQLTAAFERNLLKDIAPASIESVTHQGRPAHRIRLGPFPEGEAANAAAARIRAAGLTGARLAGGT